MVSFTIELDVADVVLLQIIFISVISGSDVCNDLRTSSIASLRLKAHNVSSMGLGGIFSPYGK